MWFAWQGLPRAGIVREPEASLLATNTTSMASATKFSHSPRSGRDDHANRAAAALEFGRQAAAGAVDPPAGGHGNTRARRIEKAWRC